MMIMRPHEEIVWYPFSDSNREPPASKAVASTNWAKGAKYACRHSPTVPHLFNYNLVSEANYRGYNIGWERWSRTTNQQIQSLLLYQLSYFPIKVYLSTAEVSASYSLSPSNTAY